MMQKAAVIGISSSVLFSLILYKKSMATTTSTTSTTTTTTIPSEASKTSIPSEASKQELRQLSKSHFGSIMIDASGNKTPTFWDEFMKLPCIDCKSTNVDPGTMHYACLCGRRCSKCFKNDCNTCDISRFQFTRV